MFALIFLTLAVISTFFLRSFENYQFYILPVIVLSILPFLNGAEFKILSACIAVWIGIEVMKFPIRFFNIDSNNFVIAQLKNDKNGLVARRISNQFKKLDIDFLNLNQLINGDAKDWLKVRPNTSFIITGDSDLYTIIFQTKTKFYDFLTSNIEYAKLESDFLILDSKYAFAFTPEEIQVAREPEEMTIDLIAYMSTAVEAESTEEFNSEMEKRIRAAAKARGLYGYWKTGTARSWAYFTEGNLELLRFLKEKDKNLCLSAKKKYSKAASLLISRGKTSLLGAYIYNNAAVTKIICDNDIRRAKNLLSKAQKLATDSRTKKLTQVNFEQVRNFSKNPAIIK